MESHSLDILDAIVKSYSQRNIMHVVSLIPRYDPSINPLSIVYLMQNGATREDLLRFFRDCQVGP